MSADVVAFPGAAGLSAAALTPLPPAPQATRFQEQYFETYRARRTVQGLKPKYAEKCLTAVVALLSFSKKSLTELTEADYELWCKHHAVDRKLSRDAQQTY